MIQEDVRVMEERSKRFFNVLIFSALFISVFVNLYTIIFSKAFWLDEWFIIFNIKYRSFLGLFGPLDYIQEFPRAYLALVRQFVVFLNYSMYSYKIIPYVVQVVNLVLLIAVLKKLLYKNEWFKQFSVYIMFSYNLITVFYFTKVKQYTMDMCFTLLAFLQFHYILKNAKNMKCSKEYAVILLVIFFGPLLTYGYEICVVPSLVLLVILFIDSIRKKQTNYLFLIPLLVFAVSLGIVYQINLKYMFSNGPQQGAFYKYFIHYDNPVVFIKQIMFSFDKFLCSLFCMPGNISSKYIMGGLALLRYVFGLLTVTGIIYSLIRMGRAFYHKEDIFTLAESSGNSYRFYFVVCFLSVFFLYCIGKLPVGEARLDYYAFLMLAYFVVAGAHVLYSWRSPLMRFLVGCYVVVSVMYFGVFYLELQYKELKFQSSGFDQGIYSNIGRALARANEIDATLVVLKDTSPVLHDLLIKAHPNYLVTKQLKIVVVDNVDAIRKMTDIAPGSKLMFIGPNFFKEDVF